MTERQLYQFDPKRLKRAPVEKTGERPTLLANADDIETPTTLGLEADAWLKDDNENGTEREYKYPELLKRLYDKRSQFGEAGEFRTTRRYIEPPAVGRMGSTKVVWTNFNSNCESIKRQPQHVLDFMLAELGTTGSIAQDNKLVMRGRFQSKQLENLLLKYIGEYVTCSTCGSPETQLKKDNRILFKVCESCGSSTAVSSIKSGYRAQTTSRRILRGQGLLT
eukprot:TRINITY_DN18_c0_g1_i1.p1 TRINITY_DN18_c0_g1~~TRINITY_DN18_c0_g1_i1.p1  ORF type:complete len:238 (-),score=55.54 TRINITY_DN18_c0_g1_i1:88-753(-)